MLSPQRLRVAQTFPYAGSFATTRRPVDFPCQDVRGDHWVSNVSVPMASVCSV